MFNDPSFEHHFAPKIVFFIKTIGNGNCKKKKKVQEVAIFKKFTFAEKQSWATEVTWLFFCFCFFLPVRVHEFSNLSLWFIIFWNIMLNTVNYLAEMGEKNAVCFENICTTTPFDSSLSLCCSVMRPSQDQDLSQWSLSQDRVWQRGKTNTRPAPHISKSRSRPRRSVSSSCRLYHLPNLTWNFSWMNYNNLSTLVSWFCTNTYTGHTEDTHSCNSLLPNITVQYTYLCFIFFKFYMKYFEMQSLEIYRCYITPHTEIHPHLHFIL